MPKILLIHADCVNPKANGDFSLAAGLAADLLHAIPNQAMDVVLTTNSRNIKTFEALYGKAVKGRITINGQSVGLCALETFDTVANEVGAFIDANRCQVAQSDSIRRVISPSTKFLFIQAANKRAIKNQQAKDLVYAYYDQEQPNLYNFFNKDDFFMGTCGLGADRMGLPRILPINELPMLSVQQQTIVPKVGYGFMYLNARSRSDTGKIIAQYIALSGSMAEYILVGDFANKSLQINSAIRTGMTAAGKSPLAPLPTIHCHPSLENYVMRRVVSGSKNDLIASTGVMSTLEAMHDKKLPYYQDVGTINYEFVASYLVAVKSICQANASLWGNRSQLIIELSNLLFEDKPLTQPQMAKTQTLLAVSAVRSNLIEVNEQIVKKANGGVAGTLLSFIGKNKSTTLQYQCAEVCSSLRKQGEQSVPVYDQALRRAASAGKLFELKILIQAMSVDDLNKADLLATGFTAMHWAVKNKHLDCVRLLINAGASLIMLSKTGNPPMYYALRNKDKAMIDLLAKGNGTKNVLVREKLQDSYAPAFEDKLPLDQFNLAMLN